ncbi:hypothetical protein AOL_s00173g158 [Orbilia oligospora ATCC 24927]|uniref:Uncharacterized protein n=1 Tax=Arthrobotrys oligospora (strain ATCC 24927 / CBS 115.81 / DSM 1491) TaxID=756982 RepID=G1XNZ0_ARTOA|nr:hypothetical protein AOL_s00173g158 [Orbilia oligospora ATCC 24927]EGX45057.1 hypothetical protein AOL_s00173g158 [Orbilia oligospora ATCC 24927]
MGKEKNPPEDAAPIIIPHSSSDEPDKPSTNSYVRVFKYNDTIGWITTAIAVACMIAAGVLLPLMNLVFGKFVNIFNDFISGRKTPEEFRSAINSHTLYFVYLFVAKFVLGYVWTTLISINAIRISRSLRLHFLKQTLRQEVGFFDSSAPGSISSNINTGVNLVNQGISEKFGLTVQATTTFFAAFVVAFVAQWKLTLIVSCIVPTILIVITICVTIDSGIEKELIATWATADKLAEEVFSSIRNVHAFWAYPKLSRKFKHIVDGIRALGRKKPPIHAVMFCIQFFCIYAGYGLAFWQGIRMYHRGEIQDPGDIVTVILAVLLAAQGLTQVAPQILVVSKATAAAGELFKTIDRKSKIDSLSIEGVKPSECHGDIVFNDVDFAYPSRPNVQVLSKLSLEFPRNKTTAIVGPSGSGKSTIVGLLERWVTSLSGTITLDGNKIEDLNINWLRTNIRLVQQEPVLFNGTIFENIAYGLSGTPEARLPDDQKFKLVEEACKAAYAHEFIEKLPKGYFTQIGERGAMISGGQKQRLAIARSIISNPKVLLLDEATSALDPNSEHIVQKALNNVATGRTTVVIAHRLSTIRDADNIIVMSKGTVVEQGTHSTLIASGGAYSRLVLAQNISKNKEDQGLEPSNRLELGRGLDTATKIPSKTGHQAKDLGATTHKNVNYNLFKCLFIIVGEQRKLWFSFTIISLAAIIAGGTYPALAVLFSRILDVFALTGDAMLKRGDFFSLMFFVMGLGNLVAYYVLGWMSATIAQEVMNSYRSEVFNNTIRQEMSFFDDPDNTTGALVSRLSTEPTCLQDLLSANIALILTITVNIVSSCILAIVYGWKLGLVLTFGALPLLVASGYVRIRLEYKLDEDTASRFANSAGIATEAVLAIRTVSSLAIEDDILAKYEKSLRSIARISVRSLVQTMFWYSLSQSISFLAMALGFWYGGRLISYEEYTSQQFYTVFIAIIFSGEAGASLFTYTSSITQAQGAANYVFNLRRQVSNDMKDEYPPRDKENTGGPAEVEFKELEFSYPRRPEIKVLKEISQKIHAGQFVAFVGASGCGKTTMINLLERFYEPSSGILYLGGLDSSSIHLGEYRRHIALVQQEPVLYQGSLRENISLGVEDSMNGDVTVTDEQIIEACRQANIDTFIGTLPEGLSTQCGSQGLQFSGGQRQRIAIARALIRQPRLLLLDEATSSLDTESEKVVQEALDSVAKSESSEGRNRTTVAVAHRLSTIKNADMVCVFSQGRIIEVGTHDQLAEEQGIYYQMCLGQSLDS